MPAPQCFACEQPPVFFVAYIRPTADALIEEGACYAHVGAVVHYGITVGVEEHVHVRRATRLEIAAGEGPADLIGQEARR